MVKKSLYRGPKNRTEYAYYYSIKSLNIELKLGKGIQGSEKKFWKNNVQ